MPLPIANLAPTLPTRRIVVKRPEDKFCTFTSNAGRHHVINSRHTTQCSGHTMLRFEQDEKEEEEEEEEEE